MNLAPLAERFQNARRRRRTEPIVGLLEQLRDLITLMPTPMYLSRPAARVSGSIGEHVRHCLDHVAAFAEAMSGEELSYDRRLRGTTVETDPVTAVHEIERLFVRLDALAITPMDRQIVLSSFVDPQRPAMNVRSTVGRELAFVVQHTIHHCALIAVLSEWQGWPVPHGFGLAPATALARNDA